MAKRINLQQNQEEDLERLEREEEDMSQQNVRQQLTDISLQQPLQQKNSLLQEQQMKLQKLIIIKQAEGILNNKINT